MPDTPDSEADTDPYAGWRYRPGDPDMVALVADWAPLSPEVAAQIARILRY